jgi:DNA-binding GntR family transcriptional regulator
MDPISNTIADLDFREPGTKLSYRDAAKIWGVSRETLRRRHQGLQATRAGAAFHKQNLNPQ